MTFSRWQSLEKFSINNTALSVTSIQFNPTKTSSLWVDRMMGSKAYHNYGYHRNFDNITAQPDLFDIIKTYKDKLPTQHELWPKCSIEILGFARSDIEWPVFRSKFHFYTKPILGTATLLVHRSKTDAKPMHEWKCYYRGAAGFHNHDEAESMPEFYYPIFFYCLPPEENYICLTYSDMSKFRLNIPFTLHMKLDRVIWSSSFQGKFRHFNDIKPDLHKIPKFAVSLVLPYTSNDMDKAYANIGMMSEFIRYYTKLGFKVFIYDSGGANYHHLRTHPYIRARNITLDYEYYNYTINGFLDASSIGMTYDNSMELTGKSQSKKLKRYRQAMDKVYTLTHSRFELKAAYGIDNVLVVDFDEFIYCSPDSYPFTSDEEKKEYRVSYNWQKEIVQYHIQKALKYGYEQLEYGQRWIVPRAIPARDCIVETAKSGRSIFECYGPAQYIAGAENRKSLHLGHACPATDFHFSCSHGYSNYNCFCANLGLLGECGMLHLSTSAKGFTEKKINAMFTPAQLEAIQNEPLELLTMSQYPA